jgi:hypothetical protein
MVEGDVERGCGIDVHRVPEHLRAEEGQGFRRHPDEVDEEILVAHPRETLALFARGKTREVVLLVGVEQIPPRSRGRPLEELPPGQDSEAETSRSSPKVSR